MERARLAVAAVVVVAACKGGDARSAAPPPPPPPPPPVTRAPVAEPPPPAPRDCDPARGAVCHDDALVACADDGTFGPVVQACKDGCRGGACVDTCAATGVELIYVVDSGNQLLSFDPHKLPGDAFHQVGTLACEPGGAPFSMAVDRRGVAWVLYHSGNVYRVSILDAHCAPSGYLPPPALSTTFGMGFASDGKAGGGEHLFITADDDSHGFGQLDTSVDPPERRAIGTITPASASNPELTGTGDGALFGYFPGPHGGFVQELDRASGHVRGRPMPLAAGGADAVVSAYAFAHWGGVFYVFATIDDHAGVYSVRRKDGAFAVVAQDLPDRIVGAGVSTCAPLLERGG